MHTVVLRLLRCNVAHIEPYFESIIAVVFAHTTLTNDVITCGRDVWLPSVRVTSSPRL